MAHTETYAVYERERRLMDEALEQGGLRIECGDLAAAKDLRMRCYNARTVERKYSKTIYEPDEPGWGHCRFDPLIFRLAGAALLILEAGHPSQLEGLRITTLDGKEVVL